MTGADLKQEDSKFNSASAADLSMADLHAPASQPDPTPSELAVPLVLFAQTTRDVSGNVKKLLGELGTLLKGGLPASETTGSQSDSAGFGSSSTQPVCPQPLPSMVMGADAKTAPDSNLTVNVAKLLDTCIDIAKDYKTLWKSEETPYGVHGMLQSHTMLGFTLSFNSQTSEYSCKYDVGPCCSEQATKQFAEYAFKLLERNLETPKNFRVPSLNDTIW